MRSALGNEKKSLLHPVNIATAVITVSGIVGRKAQKLGGRQGNFGIVIFFHSVDIHIIDTVRTRAPQDPSGCAVRVVDAVIGERRAFYGEGVCEKTGDIGDRICPGAFPREKDNKRDRQYPEKQMSVE